MRIFTWSEIPNLYIYLAYPRMQKIFLLFAEEIGRYLEESTYTEHFYHYDLSWLAEWKTKNREEKIKSILDLGFGPLSPCEHCETSTQSYRQSDSYQERLRYQNILMDEEDHETLCQPIFRLRNRIEHYAWYHHCQPMGIFTYELLQIIYPNKQWEIVHNSCHVYVQEKGVPNLAYDILVYTIPSAKESLYNSFSFQERRYRTIADFLESPNSEAWDELLEFYR